MLVFLFTDIEGSSRLWEEHTGQMGAVIARHDALLQQQVYACGGRITKLLLEAEAEFEAMAPSSTSSRSRPACRNWIFLPEGW